MDRIPRRDLVCDFSPFKCGTHRKFVAGFHKGQNEFELYVLDVRLYVRWQIKILTLEDVKGWDVQMKLLFKAFGS